MSIGTGTYRDLVAAKILETLSQALKSSGDREITFSACRSTLTPSSQALRISGDRVISEAFSETQRSHELRLSRRATHRSTKHLGQQ
jgi:hypothetical protein